MYWDEVVEIIGVYAIWSFAYPLSLLVFVFKEPLWFLAWLLVGVPLFLILRARARVLVPAWLAVWFMPGTLMCGAVAVAPWPTTVYVMFAAEPPHGCSSGLSNGICLILNLVIAYSVYPRLHRWYTTVTGWFAEDS